MKSEAHERIKTASEEVNQLVAGRPHMRISAEVEFRRRKFVELLFGDLAQVHQEEILKHLEDISHLTAHKASRIAGIWIAGMPTDSEISGMEGKAKASLEAYQATPMFNKLSGVQKEILELPPFVLPKGM